LDDRTVVVRFSPTALAGIEAFANRHRISVSGAVEKIVVEVVKQELGKKEQRQMEAESKVMAFVEQVVDRYRIAGGLDEHVIGRVFEEIRDDRAALHDYEVAVGCDPFVFGQREKARINRRVGKRVRQILNADVVTRGGRRQKGQPSRTAKSLILSYTLLEPGTPNRRRS
jgi:hypothetical protein